MRGPGQERGVVRGLWARACRMWRAVFAIAQEIFDESAYTRFLARQQLQPSQGSYAAFRREHEQSKAMRPRCC